MEILIAAGTAVLMILAFVIGIETGEKLGKRTEKPYPNAAPADFEPVVSEEEQKRRFEEDQKAFAQCMNYSLEKAYGSNN